MQFFKSLLKCAALFTVCHCAVPWSVIGQTKGVGAMAANEPVSATVNTYALVVGISNYQDPVIPDLKYADRDAMAFADFLRSKAGGQLDDAHLKLMLNQEATLGQFAAALDWLLEVCKEGDRAIIYFSGHGDVERKTVSQPGFLLCWDAPGRVYMSGGAFGLGYLEEIITTLSTINKSKVWMVADACHSGKLSGSQIGGAQATAASLSRQYANEIKILSCQPNEFSLEGEQWGGGRGVFSYYLVDGLKGLANLNNDSLISLHELNRFLEDKVIPEAAPQNQIPMVIGNKTEVLSKIDQKLLQQLIKSKEGQLVTFVQTESKGLEEQVLEHVDSLRRWSYMRFKEMLLAKKFFSPEKDCADHYYRMLEHDENLGPLLNSMKRNYAAALQDDAQQIMNKLLQSELMELSLSVRAANEKYNAYPEYLDRAAELLGTGHYMHPFLKARKYFFEAYLKLLSNKHKDLNVGSQVLEKLNAALTYQPDMPHIYWMMSLVHGFSLGQADSSIHYADRAVQMVPSWQLPYVNLLFLLADKWKDMEKAAYYLEKINAVDSTNLVACFANAIYHDVKGVSGTAEYFLKRALEQNPEFVAAHNLLGNIYLNTGQLDLSRKHYLAAIQQDPDYPMAHTNLGIVYYIEGNKQNALKEFEEAHRLDPRGPFYNYNLACYYGGENQVETAFQYLEAALQNGWTNYAYLMDDSALENLRKEAKRWEEMMNKYFPNRQKK